MATPLTAVRLRRVLDRLQVVCHGDYREQDQQQHRESDKLQPPVCA
jgi:hypothetical protein